MQAYNILNIYTIPLLGKGQRAIMPPTSTHSNNIKWFEKGDLQYMGIFERYQDMMMPEATSLEYMQTRRVS
jgi:hypothetical protein